jgi:6,7-dimethyl-8-ribityllumazine synthase
MSERDIDTSSENVLSDWKRSVADGDELEEEEEEGEEPAGPHAEPDEEDEGTAAWGTAPAVEAEAPEAETSGSAVEAPAEPAEEVDGGEPAAEPAAEAAPDDSEAVLFPVELSHEHAAGDLHIPDGYAVLEGVPEGGRRAVGVVVSRFNGDVTTRLLDRALEELSSAGVRREAITIMVVPGAFELPLAATALAKTRRFACIVALGCVIRGDTPHFDYVASEAASGLQLAALETGVPVSFGVLTLDRVEQADPRIEKGADAVRSALEMADLFAHLRAAASR